MLSIDIAMQVVSCCLQVVSAVIYQILFSGIGSGNIAYIELFQRNSIIKTSLRSDVVRVNFSRDYETLMINVSLMKPVSH